MGPAVLPSYVCATVSRCGLTELTWDRLSSQLQDSGTGGVSADCLVSLDVSGNELTSLQGLEEYRNVCSLRLANNQLCDLQLLPAVLSHLDVSRNQFTSLAGLAQLPHLVWLDASHNRLTSLRDLAGCRQLQHLAVGHNNIARLAGLEDAFALRRLDLTGTQVRTELELRPLGLLPYLRHLRLAGTPLVERLSGRQARLLLSNILPELRTLDDVAMPSNHGAYRGLQSSSEQPDLEADPAFGIEPLFNMHLQGEGDADGNQVAIMPAPKKAVAALLGLAKSRFDEAAPEAHPELDAFLRDASDNPHALSCEEEVRSIFYDLSRGNSLRLSENGAQAQAGVSMEQVWQSLKTNSPRKQPKGKALRPTVSRLSTPRKSPRARAGARQATSRPTRTCPVQQPSSLPRRSKTLETPRSAADMALDERAQAFLAWSPGSARSAMALTGPVELAARSGSAGSVPHGILKTRSQEGVSYAALGAPAQPPQDIYAQVAQLLHITNPPASSQTAHPPAQSEAGSAPRPVHPKQAAWLDQPQTFTTAQLLAATIAARQNQQACCSGEAGAPALEAHQEASPAGRAASSIAAASAPGRPAVGSSYGSDERSTKAVPASKPSVDRLAPLQRQQTPSNGAIPMLRSPPRGLDQLGAEDALQERLAQSSPASWPVAGPTVEATYAGIRQAPQAGTDDPDDFGQHPYMADRPAHVQNAPSMDDMSAADATAAALLLTPPLTPRQPQLSGPVSDVTDADHYSRAGSPATLPPAQPPQQSGRSSSPQHLHRDTHGASKSSRELRKAHGPLETADDTAANGAVADVYGALLNASVDKQTQASTVVNVRESAAKFSGMAAAASQPGNAAQFDGADDADGLIKALKQAISLKRHNLEETFA